MAWEELYSGAPAKVALFMLVQALVYFIISRSSDVFSLAKMRSASFRTVRSVSIRRLLAALSDMPPDGELSPMAPSRTISRRSSDVSGELSSASSFRSISRGNSGSEISGEKSMSRLSSLFGRGSFRFDADGDRPRR